MIVSGFSLRIKIASKNRYDQQCVKMYACDITMSFLNLILRFKKDIVKISLA